MPIVRVQNAVDVTKDRPAASTSMKSCESQRPADVSTFDEYCKDGHRYVKYTSQSYFCREDDEKVYDICVATTIVEYDTGENCADGATAYRTEITEGHITGERTKKSLKKKPPHEWEKDDEDHAEKEYKRTDKAWREANPGHP